MAATGTVVVAYFVAAQLSTAAQQRAWPGGDSYVWEHNVGAGIAAYTHGSVRPTVAENTTPYEMLADIYPPYNHLSYVLPFYEPHVHVDGPIDGPLVGINPLGGVQPTATHVLQTMRFPARGCLHGGTRGLSLWRNVTVHPPTSAGPFYLMLNYGPATTAEIMSYYGDAPYYPPQDDIGVELDARAGESIAYIGPDLPKQIIVNIPRVSYVCLTSMQIDTLSLT